VRIIKLSSHTKVIFSKYYASYQASIITLDYPYRSDLNCHRSARSHDISITNVNMLNRWVTNHCCSLPDSWLTERGQMTVVLAPCHEGSLVRDAMGLQKPNGEASTALSESWLVIGDSMLSPREPLQESASWQRNILTRPQTNFPRVVVRNKWEEIKLGASTVQQRSTARVTNMLLKCEPKW
jgi:hypothetical protein